MSDHSPERRKGAKLFNGFVLRSVTTLSSQMLSKGNELPTINPSLELIKEGSLSSFSIWVCKRSQCNGRVSFLRLLLPTPSVSWLPCFASLTHMVTF
uniref:Uncharacterized protein n=1 Tax=Rhizophora mucronata TaxID=61149 RepID=A0A2P2MH91_RHIMU